ncbi:MAG TPA: CHAT domain-containing tetratricopeptide repeat protein [Candidatus Saccharimonadaceae bacterium]|jgi:CHAT domain-containing protein/tetratricopeptide (TPR) repeat protein|nr:CHAT domain-containing tetratricopeptide repeat protein [Candidatus Saccharimonadaceae bacterium]
MMGPHCDTDRSSSATRRVVAVWALAFLALASGCAAGRAAHEPRAAAAPPHASRSGSGPAPVDSLAIAADAFTRGVVLADRAKPDSALAAYELSRGIYERHAPPNKLMLARIDARVGGALGELAQFDDARAALRSSLAYLDHMPPPDSIALAEALNADGRVMHQMRNYAEARRALERALAIRQRTDSPTSPAIRTVLTNLANAVASLGDLEGARPYFERLVKAADDATPRDSLRLGNALLGLANVVSDLKDYTAGAVLYDRALAVREAYYGPKSGKVGMTLQSMGSLAEVMGDPVREEQYCSRARAIYRGALGEGHAMTAEITVNEADVLRRLGRRDEAFDLALRGEQLTREHLRRTAQGLDESEALQYEGTRLEGLSLAVAIAVEDSQGSPRVAQTFDALIRSRGLLLDELAERRRTVDESTDSTARELRDAWAGARDRYAALAMRSPGSADTKTLARVDEARRQADEAEAALAMHSREMRRHAGEVQLGLDEVRRALPVGTALVRFVEYEWRTMDTPATSSQRYAAVILTGGRTPVCLVSLGGATEIDSLIGQWRALVTQRDSTVTPRAQERRYREVAGALRGRVWDPVAAKLGGASRVMLVPDGALQLLAFGTLPVGADRYLVESGPLLHYLDAERDLARPVARRAGAASVLAVGGADFDRGAALPVAVASTSGATAFRGGLAPCPDLKAMRFGALPSTAGEARDVANLLRESRHLADADVALRTGGQATEAEFKAEAPRARYIHIATHGFFVDPSCEDGSVNPLLLSGLALAGANQRASVGEGDEDGLLTAEEVAAMDLSNAEWVVLSACDTGLGSLVSGEGVFGLRRAFGIAGAGTVIMSLWKVPDAATERWMHTLYESHYRGGLGTAESVRAAAVAELRRLRSHHDSTLPTSWGAFIASGDWR